MRGNDPVLHLFCGKIASGKSTLAAQIAREGAVLISEDDWLGALFAEELRTGTDYLRCSAKLQTAMGPHVASLLAAGLFVALDFPANTLAQRAWMRGILDLTGGAHRLHFLDVPDEDCLGRLHARNAGGGHPFAATEALFRRFSAHFVAPQPEEGFDIVMHRQDG